MSNAVIHDPDDAIVTGRVIDFQRSRNAPEHAGMEDCICDPDLSSVVGVMWKYWKVVTGSVVEMLTEEKTDYDVWQITFDPEE